jgi:AbrB family looped-hinge helix DNA binding protein
MMHKLTSKRQVTIPQKICSALSLKPSDYVEIFERDGVAHLVKMNHDDLAGQFSDLLTKANFPTDEEINKAVKKRTARKFSEQ